MGVCINEKRRVALTQEQWKLRQTMQCNWITKDRKLKFGGWRFVKNLQYYLAIMTNKHQIRKIICWYVQSWRKFFMSKKWYQKYEQKVGNIHYWKEKCNRKCPYWLMLDNADCNRVCKKAEQVKSMCYDSIWTNGY